MNMHTNIAGQIKVGVHYRRGYIQQVELISSRPVQLTRMLEGKTPDEVVQQVPLLFSLCRCAQSVATLTAIESLQGWKPHAAVIEARQFLLLAETARELGIRLARDWMPESKVIDLPKLLCWYAEVSNALSWALLLKPGREPSVLAYSDWAAELCRILSVITEADELQFKEAVLTHRRSHPVGQVVAELSETFKGIELGRGCHEIQMTPGYLGHKLNTDAFEFCAKPVTETGCLETSVWTRNRTRQMIKESELLSMHPLAQRFLALLLELRSLPQRLHQIKAESLIEVEEPGLVKVEAARGMLVHQLKTEISDQGERVRGFKLIAPTEWNFHPQGTLVRMLEGVRVPADKLKLLVEKLVLAVDPCVSYEVEVI